MCLVDLPSLQYVYAWDNTQYYAPLQLVRYITLVSMSMVYISIIRYS